MYYFALMRELSNKTEEIKKFQDELDKELLYTEDWLDKSIEVMNVMERRLKQLKSERDSLRKKSTVEKPHISEQDFERMLEKVLQGSMQSLGNKISQKILDKLKDLKSASYEVRKIKIRELKELVDSEQVDLSQLFREKIKSNIDDIGVEEQEVRGIDKSLEKLRRMMKKKDGQEGHKKDSD